MSNFKRIPKEALSWEAEIEGSIKYQSDRILNLQIKHYTYTGGAHGYQGLRSLLLILPAENPSQTINCLKTGCFKAFAEKNLEPNIISQK
jgi:hypothetical protein